MSIFGLFGILKYTVTFGAVITIQNNYKHTIGLLNTGICVGLSLIKSQKNSDEFS